MSLNYDSYVYDSTAPLATYEVVEGSEKLKRTDGGTTTPILGQYSSLMDSKPTMLFLFSLDPEVGNKDRTSLTFKVKGETTYDNSHFKITDKKPVKELKSTENDLSAIVEFSGMGITSAQLTSITADGKYNMNGYLKTIDFSSTDVTRYHIPTVSSSGSTAGDFNVTYESSLSLTPLTLTPNYPEYVAIVCEYYEDALEYLYAINLGNENLNQDSLGFSCDFDLEVL